MWRHSPHASKPRGAKSCRGRTTRPGRSLSRFRTSQLSKADVVVAIISPESANSPYVVAELGAATAFKNKLLIPILLDGAEPPASIGDRLYISSSSDETDETVAQILQSLKHRSTTSARDRALLVTTLLGALASILGTVVSVAASDLAQDTLPFLSKIHWTIWVCSIPALFAEACYINDRRPEEKRKFPTLVSVPVWTQLRGFGDKRVARISYVALAMIPMIAYAVSENPFDIKVFESLALPLGFRLTFFASWFFSVALILFVAGCPKPFRHVETLEHARTVNLVLHESPSANVIVDSPSEVEDPALDSSALELRAACFIFSLLLGLRWPRSFFAVPPGS